MSCSTTELWWQSRLQGLQIYIGRTPLRKMESGFEIQFHNRESPRILVGEIFRGGCGIARVRMKSSRIVLDRSASVAVREAFYDRQELEWISDESGLRFLAFVKLGWGRSVLLAISVLSWRMMECRQRASSRRHPGLCRGVCLALCGRPIPSRRPPSLLRSSLWPAWRHRRDRRPER